MPKTPTEMAAWCEQHWLRWETLTPAQAARAEALATGNHLLAVPAALRGGLVRWIVKGTAPGSFLSAVLCNDLAGAVRRIDDENRAYLCDLVAWIWQQAPSQCWGSPQRVAAWPLIAVAAKEPADG